MAHLHCPSGAPLCYAVCHTPCCSYSLRSGSYLCPSCHFIHFVLRSASLHHVRSFDIAKRHGTLSNTQSKAQVMHIPLRKPTLQYSLCSIPLHYVLHSLQSHSVHPLPIILRALRPATAAGLSWFLSGAHSIDENKNTRQTLAFLVAVYRRCTAL